MKTREEQIIEIAKTFREIMVQNEDNAMTAIDIAETALKVAIPSYSIKITTSAVGMPG